MTRASAELLEVARLARVLMAPLPEGAKHPHADAYFWARFDALGRALDRLERAENLKRLDDARSV